MAHQVLAQWMYVRKKDAKELTGPPWQEARDNARFVSEGLCLVVTADKHDLSVHDEDVAILQEAVLISSCCNLCPSDRLAPSRVNKEQEELEKAVNLPQIPTHVPMMPPAVHPHLLPDLATDYLPDDPLKASS
jgi:hypothetical protein